MSISMYASKQQKKIYDKIVLSGCFHLKVNPSTHDLNGVKMINKKTGQNTLDQNRLKYYQTGRSLV